MDIIIRKTTNDVGYNTELHDVLAGINPEKLIKQLERAQKQIDKNPDKVDEIISKHIYKKEKRSV